MIDITKIEKELKQIENLIEKDISSSDKEKHLANIDALKNGYLIHRENMLIIDVLDALKHQIRMIQRQMETQT